jgi:hypothetical protein
MGEGELERDLAAERVPDESDLFEPEMRENCA